MSGALHIQRQNYHATGAARRRVLLHVPTTSVFELDRVSSDVLDFLEESESIVSDAVRSRFDGLYAPGEVCDALSDFVALGILAPARKEYSIAPRPVTRTPLNTLVLTLTTGCNLGCSYCYREDLDAPKAARVMERATALQAIDLLMRQAADQERVAIVFFGGEPLTRFADIRALTEAAEARAMKAGKRVDFSLTTNATLLDDAMIEFFRAHRFGIAVSMDGDEVEHDRRRITLGGKGTYKLVAANVRRLLQAGLERPPGARVTLTRGSGEVGRIYRHLHEEIGFSEIGFAPVTADPGSPLGLGAAEMRRVLDGMIALGRDYADAAKRGERHGFSNMDHLMLDLWRGTRKTLPCGAGVGLLAAGTDGSLSLCHRFTGTGVGSFGDVANGIDQNGLGHFLDRAQAAHPACDACHARSICAGGCYHEAYVHSGDPLAATFGHCEFVRAWLEFGLACYGEIAIANPGFFAAKFAERKERS
ncbi:MAG: quinohemoprotein amine dehydrogenase maturation protein [Rhodocyclaceae bacterium]|nr:quinohemoprotein amine dehydrogenase maturation protein [Rhodocyclaceae bacterium]